MTKLYKRKLGVIILCCVFICSIGLWEESSVFAAPSNKTDTRLSQLSIACGSLTPEFSPDVYDYQVYVTKEQTSRDCKTSVKLKDSTAKVTAEGPAEFQDSDVEKKITVTASGSEKSIYTIKVHIVQDNEILEEGKLYQVAKTIPMNTLPEGFKKSKCTVKGKSISVAKNENANLILVPYENVADVNDTRWYSYDQSKDELDLAELKKIEGATYVTVTSGKELVYGSNDGTSGYYLYDVSTGEIQSLSTEGISQGLVILIIAIVLTIIVCIVLFVVLRRGRKRKIPQRNETKYFRPYLSFDEEKRKQKGE